MHLDRDLPLIREARLTLRRFGLAPIALGLLVATGCEEPAPANRTPRGVRGGPFVCTDDHCAQAFPTYPDDGEWECIDTLGVVVCRGGIPAAGVLSGPADASFVCGALPRDDAGRRVCVDATPDVPDGFADDWRCVFDRDGAGEVRRCDRTASRPWLEAPCGTCPAGLTCVHGRCSLPEGVGPPDCWLDGDCEGGATCVLARCTSR